MIRSPQPRFPPSMQPGGFAPQPQPGPQPQMPMQMPMQQQQQQQQRPGLQHQSQPSSLPMEHTDVIHDLQFDYYGQMLATASSDRTIGVHIVRDGQLQRVATLTGHDGPVWMVSWAHPRLGTALASAGYDHRAIVWKQQQPQQQQQPPQWRPVHVIDCHQGSVNAVQWALDAALVATASSDGTVAVTALHAGVWRESVRLSNNSNHIAHAMGATCVSFAPTWAPRPELVLLASGGCDAQVRLWAARDGPEAPQSFELLASLDGHTDWVRDVAFAPFCAATRHAVLASCAQDQSVIIHRRAWAHLGEADTAGEGQWERSVVMFDEPVWRLAWSPTGEMLVATTGSSEVFILCEGADFTRPWIKTPLSEYQSQ